MYRHTRTPIVGRAGELDQIGRFLAAARHRAGGLVLHGRAGMGKTTLWQHATSEAAALDFRVVSTRPTEAEARLPYAGLTDLFGDLLDELQPVLPAPQLTALNVALLRAEAGEARPEPLAISFGLLGLIRASVARQPLAVMIDDVQWLDASTASVLEFVLRRLDGDPVVVAVTARTAASSSERPDALPVVRALGPERLVLLDVAPLSVRDVDRLISSTLALDLAPTMIRQLHRVSGGNPFYAIELGRALQRRGLTTIPLDMPLPDTLGALVRDRLSGLSPATRELAGYAAALSHPDRSTLAAALGADAAAAGLDEGIAAGVFTGADPIRFSHPLLAAEAYTGLGEVDRRQVHRRLAAVVGEPEERARHLAIATEGPDEAVAAELEAAAEHAHHRAAPDAAADLAERAADLTPADDEAGLRRTFAAARYRLLAGEAGRSRTMLETALSRERDSDRRAAILARLAGVQQLLGDWKATERLLRDALPLVTNDPRLEVEVKLGLAAVSYITGRDQEGGGRHAAGAMAIAQRLGDPRLLAGTIGHFASWRYELGDPPDPELERLADELEPSTQHLRTMDHPDYDFSVIRWNEGDVEGFRERHERLADRAERIGDYSSLSFLLGNLVGADFWQGRLDVAAERLDHAERLARATGQRTALAHHLMCRTFLAGRLGDAEAAWRHGRAALDLIADTGWMHGKVSVLGHLAELELSRRDYATTEGLMRPLGEAGVEPGRHSPTVALLQVEALVGLGKVEDAAAVLDRHPEPGGRERPWTADAFAARGLLAAASGDLQAATEFLEAAQRVAERYGDRWRLARTLLIAADVHRRTRRRARARDALARSIELFAALGSSLWVANARDQVRRLSAARDGSVGLTPTQREVSELVSQGLTNRQVADRLFMSPHTVEAHLSAVYRALGLTSRGQLRAALAGSLEGSRDSLGDLRDSAERPHSEVEGPAEFR